MCVSLFKRKNKRPLKIQTSPKKTVNNFKTTLSYLASCLFGVKLYFSTSVNRYQKRRFSQEKRAIKHEVASLEVKINVGKMLPRWTGFVKGAQRKDVLQ